MFGNFTRCRQHSNKLLQIDLAFFFIIIEESRERQTIEISTFREKDTGILIRELLLQGLINIIAAQRKLHNYPSPVIRYKSSFSISLQKSYLLHLSILRSSPFFPEQKQPSSIVCTPSTSLFSILLLVPSTGRDALLSRSKIDFHFAPVDFVTKYRSSVGGGASGFTRQFSREWG